MIYDFSINGTFAVFAVPEKTFNVFDYEKIIWLIRDSVSPSCEKQYDITVKYSIATEISSGLWSYYFLVMLGVLYYHLIT